MAEDDVNKLDNLDKMDKSKKITSYWSSFKKAYKIGTDL